jgi:hypothetical protein
MFDDLVALDAMHVHRRDSYRSPRRFYPEEGTAVRPGCGPARGYEIMLRDLFLDRHSEIGERRQVVATAARYSSRSMLAPEGP